MARTVSQIQDSIQTSLVANLASVGVTLDTTQWSKFNVLRMICFTFAVCAAYIEQLMDELKSEIESTASMASAASALWLQMQMFQFQYSATNPQILQIINTVAQYPVIDNSLCIISGCSISSTTSNQVVLKVATGNPFTALSSPQLAAAQGYVNQLGSAGIIYNVVSLDADLLYLNANIYYQGQYSAVIQANVLAAINSYLQNLATTSLNSISSTSGAVKLSDIETTIRSVAGVNDVVLLNVSAMANGVSLGSAVSLVNNQLVLLRQWIPFAGYTILDNTNTLLTFVAE